MYTLPFFSKYIKYTSRAKNPLIFHRIQSQVGLKGYGDCKGNKVVGHGLLEKGGVRMENGLHFEVFDLRVVGTVWMRNKKNMGWKVR